MWLFKETVRSGACGYKKADLKQLIEEDHGAEAVCRFCHKKYHFNEVELTALLDQKAI